MLAFLAAWQVVTAAGLVSDIYVASRSTSSRPWRDLAGDDAAWAALDQTAWSVLTAFVFGTAAGLVVGFALGLSKLLRKAYMGPVLFLLATPQVDLPAPADPADGHLVVLERGVRRDLGVLLRRGRVVGGVDLVEERHLRVARAFGGGGWDRIRDVVVPASLPGLFAALWQGLNHAFGGVMLAELFASRGGIGQLVWVFAEQLPVPPH